MIECLLIAKGSFVINSELQLFNNPEFGEVRAVEISGKPYVVAKDAAKALGYGNDRQAIKTNVDEDDKVVHLMDTPGGKQKMTLINESGLYALILGSQLPKAKEFKRWVTAEVLPAIRKTGRYDMGMTDAQRMRLEIMEKNAKARNAQILERIAAQYDGTYKQVLHSYATRELTGEHLLPLPQIAEKTCTATEIGEQLGISANMVGTLTNSHNLKTDEYGAWFNDKAKGHSKEVQTFRYFEKVIPVLEAIINRQSA